MIPVLDLLIKDLMKEGIEHLRQNIDKVDRYFSHLPEKNMEDIKFILENINIPVLCGFPREENKIPCLVVMVAGEDEVPYGLGDGIDERYYEQGLGEDNYLNWSPDGSKYIQENIQMNAQIRIEVWSDNAIMTSLLYAITKYCFLRAKTRLVQQGILTPTLGGGDLEPVPEYLSFFIYRKALTINLEYTASYHVEDYVIGKEDDQFELGTTIDDIDFESFGYYKEKENGRKKD